MTLSTSTVDPKLPADGTKAHAADMRKQFGAVINDINALYGQLPGGGGNFSNAVVGPDTAPLAVRSLASRAGDVANVQDFLTIATDAASAANQAFASLPSTGGEIYFPAGVYTLPASLAFSGKAVTITGAGIGVTTLIITHTGWGIDISQSAITQYIVIRDINIVAQASAQSNGAVRVISSTVGSWPLSNLIMQNVSISGTFNSSGAGTFQTGISLKGCWQPQLINVSGSGTGLSNGGAVTGTTMINLDAVVGLVATNLVAYYYDNVINQISYCEGVNLMAPQVVACNMLYQQTGVALSTANLTLNGLWMVGGEVNCHNGVFNISQSTTCFINGTDMNRYGNSGSQWTVFNLVDAQYWLVTGIKVNGGGATTSQVFAISHSGGTGSSGALNHFYGIIAGNCQVASTLGSGTAYNKISGFMSLLTGGPAAAVIDSGTFNDVTYQGFNGVANANNWQFEGAAGQLLMGIANVASAVNAPWFFPSVTGDANGVQLKMIGTDTNVGFKVVTQGTAGMNFAGANGSMLVLAQPAGTIAGFIEIFGAVTGSQPKIQLAGSDTNIGLTISTKGTAGTVIGNDNGTTFVVAQGSGTAQANYWQFLSSATGNQLNMSAQGSDTNVGMTLSSKGNAGIVLSTGNGTAAAFAQGAGTAQANYWLIQSAASGANVKLNAAGTDTNVGMSVNSQGNAGIVLGNGNGTLAVFAQGSGTAQSNYFQYVSGPAGTGPTIYSVGGDTNISFTMSAKGSGGVTASNGNGALFSHIQGSGTTQVNYLQSASAATGNAVSLTATGTDTNVNMQLAGKGTGGIYLNPVRVNMANLPTSASGLSAGDIWKDTANSNVLKVV